MKRFLMMLGMMALAGCATTPADVHSQAAAGGNQAVDRVAQSLNSTNPAVRQAAIEELLKMKNSSAATGYLLSATLSPDPAVRGDAGAALLFQPQVDLDFYAVTLIADKDAGVRKRMAEGLTAAGRAGPYAQTRVAGLYLWGLEQDDNAEVRAAAAQGLGELGLEDPIDFSLAALRQDPDPRVRAAAARGLGTPARLYLAGERGPGWGDQQVEQFLAGQTGGQLSTPVQKRGAEIVAALCHTAQTDNGVYVDVYYVGSWWGSGQLEQKHWVALEAANALTVLGKPPSAEVAAAQAAAAARVPTEVLANLPASEKTTIHPLREAGD